MASCRQRPRARNMLLCRRRPRASEEPSTRRQRLRPSPWRVVFRLRHQVALPTRTLCPRRELNGRFSKPSRRTLQDARMPRSLSPRPTVATAQLACGPQVRPYQRLARLQEKIKFPAPPLASAGGPRNLSCAIHRLIWNLLVVSLHFLSLSLSLMLLQNVLSALDCWTRAPNVNLKVSFSPRAPPLSSPRQSPPRSTLGTSVQSVSPALRRYTQRPLKGLH